MTVYGTAETQYMQSPKYLKVIHQQTGIVMKTIKNLREEIKKTKKYSGIIPAPIHFKNGRDISYEDWIKLISEKYESKLLNKLETPAYPHTWFGNEALDQKFDMSHLYENMTHSNEEHDHIKNYTSSHGSENLNKGLLDYYNKYKELVPDDEKLSQHLLDRYPQLPLIRKDHIQGYSKNMYSKDLKNPPQHYNGIHLLSDIHRHLSNAIDRHPLNSDTQTYSGTTFDPLEHVDENGQLHSPSHISSSLSKRVSSAFAGITSKNDKLLSNIIHFHLKKGDPAMPLQHLSRLPHEYEVVIKSGTRLQHLGHEEYGGERDHKKVIIHHISIVKE